MRQTDFTKDHALARSTDPATSKAAAAKVNVSDREQIVLKCLREQGDATCREIAQRSGLDYASVTPRIKPLRNKGLVTHALDDEGQFLRRAAQYVWKAV
jgi:DNA-binding MarR family transcriptional regulator